ncbi:polyhomeotic 2 isoform X2, partial [Brachionus plicatilis]
QPKPAQPPHPQAPAATGDPPPHSQFLFQSVGHKANAAGSVPAQAAAAPVQHQLSATSTNIQMLQQRLAEEEHRQEQLLKQLNEKKHQAKAKSPDKKAKCDAMDVDEWSHDDANSLANSSGVHSKKRGRPRLYAVDALTGKSIKGKLIENKQKSPKVAQQPPAQLQFAIYPSPSTSASSSSYSQQHHHQHHQQNHQQHHQQQQQQQQQQNFIINQPAPFNQQFIPLNIVQPMIQEEKNEPEAEQQTTQASTQSEQQNSSKSSEKEAGEMSVSGQTSVSATPEREDKKVVDTLKNLKSKVVLTHVIDGFVIKESSEPFPVKAGEVQRMCVEQRTPPKSTSTPCDAIKRQDQSNTSRLLDENSLLNTSVSSQKAKAKSRPKQSPKRPRTEELDAKSAAAQPNAAAAVAASVCRQEWPSGDPTEWNCEQVYAFVVLVAGEQVAEMFRSQDMDGSALSLIRDDHLVNTMGVKLGPALKIMSKFNEFKIKFSQSL